MKGLDEGDGLMLSVSYEGGSECEKKDGVNEKSPQSVRWGPQF